MRYLAIDLGDKRTGTALGDDGSGIATPYETVITASAAERLRQLTKLIEAESPDAVVIGLPLHMDGSEGLGVEKARALGASIHQATNTTVLYADERQTSQMADEHMAGSGLTHKQKKARRDALAAMSILRIFFEHGPIGGGG